MTKRILVTLFSVLFMGLAINTGGVLAAKCAGGGSFLALPTWYQYLECEPSGDPPKSTPKMDADRFLPNLLLVGLAIIELLIRLSGILAIGYIVWGGIKYTTSQGSPEGIKSARETIIQAIIGLVIIILATSLVSTVARIVSKGYN